MEQIRQRTDADTLTLENKMATALLITPQKHWHSTGMDPELGNPPAT